MSDGTDDTLPRAGSERTPPLSAEIGEAVAEANLARRLFGEQRQAPRIGRFAILSPLGEGGMGAVFMAYDETLDRRVAVKLLHAHAVDDAARARIVREGRAMARLSHPNVVQVFEVGEQDDRPWIAMEYIQGSDLRAWVESGERDWRSVLDAYVQAGEGLAAAHDAGLVHRDFKPSNAMIDEELGRVRVLDFGLAGREGTGPPPSLGDSTQVDAADAFGTLTQTGSLMGTPAYMAPEQIAGEPADGRTDQFSFCIAVWEALYGQSPFEGTTIEERFANVSHGRIEPPADPGRAPAWCLPTLQRGLSPNADDRFATMGDLVVELRRDRSAPRRVGVALSAVSALAVLAAGAGWWFGNAADPPLCTDAAAELDGIWGTAQREALSAALLRSDLGFADSTARIVDEQLQTWAEAWAASYTDACEQTLVHRRQSARMMDLRTACLRRRRGELKAAVDVLSEGGEETVIRAVRIARDLTPPSSCDEIERLAAAIDPPDPSVAADVEAQREVLALVATRKTAADFTTARSLVEGVVAAAQDIGYRPLLAEAQFHLAGVSSAQGNQDVAERASMDAFRSALASGYDEMLAQSANQMVYVLAAQRRRPDLAQPWLGHAEAATERLPDDASAQLRLMVRQGLMHHRQRRPDEAVALMRSACAQAETHLGVDHPDVMGCRSNLAVYEQTAGNLDAAEALGRQALAQAERLWDPMHPSVGYAHNLLGNIATARGDEAAALAEYRLTLRVFESAYGAAHPRVAGAEYNIGNRLRGAGHNAQARARYERAHEIHAAADGPDSPDAVSSLNMIALTHQNEDHPELALGIYEHVIAAIEREPAIGAQELGIAHNNLGNVLMSLGRPKDAIGHYLTSRTTLAKELGADHAFVGSPLCGLGDAYMELAQHELAVTALQEALTLYEAGKNANTPQTRYVLARALWLSQRREEARSHLRLLVEQSSPKAALAKHWLASDVMPDDDAP